MPFLRLVGRTVGHLFKYSLLNNLYIVIMSLWLVTVWLESELSNQPANIAIVVNWLHQVLP
jgi:hypothetical protein